MADPKTDIQPEENPEDREERRVGDSIMPRLERDLVALLDEMINQFQAEPLGEEPREYLEALRVLLKSQVTSYMAFIKSRRSLSSTTSTMYADEVGPAGLVTTTLRGLIEGGAMTTAQAGRLAGYVTDRRTLLIFGDRATGKSTLLNSLFELVSVDERFVAIERGPDLPALKERSFCVRLGVDGDTDLPALFAKVRRMDPGRLVIGEMHAQEVREFFSFLAEDPRCGGLATVRAETVHRALDGMVAAFGGDHEYARGLLARVKPVLVHMHSDEKGRPRLAAIWNVEGLDGGELVLREVQTAASAASLLVAET